MTSKLQSAHRFAGGRGALECNPTICNIVHITKETEFDLWKIGRQNVRAMAVTSPTSSKRVELFIAKPEITEALNTKRPIPKLSTEEVTSIRFSVRHDGYCASVCIDITPFRLEGTANPEFRAFYQATAYQRRFQDSELYEQIQKIHDATIPVQWILVPDW